MGLTSALVQVAVDVIDRLGYGGVFLLMAFESMVLPVPSEGVMPFAGFLVASGRFRSLWLVTTVATIGSLAGSWLSYELGKHWGRPFIDRWGRWLLVSRSDLDWSERFFRRYGTGAILVARFIPVVRHLISIPAGVARMKLAPFLVATAIGAFLWNGFLAYLGLLLGQNWERVKEVLEPVDLGVLLVLLVGLAAFVWAHVRAARRTQAATPPPPD